jgi:TRAP-type uncharacterized transport system substrate-binding protein
VKTASNSPPSRRRLLAVLALALVALLAIGWAVAGRNALPPRSIVMATGPEGGSYAALAQRYREALLRHGLELELRATQGDVENLALLQDPRSGVSVAFLQSGTTTEEASPGLVSLGAMFLQPIWVFRRGESPPMGLGGLDGKTVSAGLERSGTRAVVRRLLALAGVEPQGPKLVGLPPTQAADALDRGEIDAVALVSSWESPVVRRLVAAPGVSLDGFPRADAYVALDPSLEKVVLPQGVGDLARNRPPRDVPLLALKVSLVVPRDVNPASSTSCSTRPPTSTAGPASSTGRASSRPPRGWTSPSVPTHATSSSRVARSCSATSRTGWRCWWSACCSCSCPSWA